MFSIWLGQCDFDFIKAWTEKYICVVKIGIKRRIKINNPNLNTFLALCTGKEKN